MWAPLEDGHSRGSLRFRLYFFCILNSGLEECGRNKYWYNTVIPLLPGSLPIFVHFAPNYVMRRNIHIWLCVCLYFSFVYYFSYGVFFQNPSSYKVDSIFTKSCFQRQKSNILVPKQSTVNSALLCTISMKFPCFTLPVVQRNSHRWRFEATDLCSSTVLRLKRDFCSKWGRTFGSWWVWWSFPP